jgi:MFS transporter, DHA1 family, inner membrane transport protein
VLVVTGFWFAVANGRSVSASAMISHMVDSRNRGSFMSFNASLQQLFIGTASFLAGLIVASDANHKVYYYNWVGYLSIAVLAFCLLLPGIIVKRMKSESNSIDPVI